MFLGFFKLLVGLLFGESLTALLHRFPLALLTVMIIAAGLELASVGESLNTERARDLGKEGDSGNTSPARQHVQLSDEEKKRRWTVMLVTAGLLVAFKNDAIGFLGGMFCHWSYSIPVYQRPQTLSRSASNIDSDATGERQSLLPH